MRVDEEEGSGRRMVRSGGWGNVGGGGDGVKAGPVKLT